MSKDEKIKCHFEMSLWQRIRAASLVWWNIVVTKEISCVNDEVQDV